MLRKQLDPSTSKELTDQVPAGETNLRHHRIEGIYSPETERAYQAGIHVQDERFKE